MKLNKFGIAGIADQRVKKFRPEVHLNTVFGLPYNRIEQKQNNRIKVWVFPTIFIMHFFLPYIPGTRVRFDVLFGYLCVILVLLKIFREISESKLDRELLLISAFCASATIASLILHPGDFTKKAVILTNYNFMGIATCTFIILKKYLLKHKYHMLIVLMVASLVINAIACGQWLWPRAPYNIALMELYRTFDTCFNGFLRIFLDSTD